MTPNYHFLATPEQMPKPHRITTPRHLDAAIAGLLAADARFQPVLARTGKPPHRHRRAEGFEALVSIVVNQQLSTAAADTIFARLKQQLVPFDPATVLAAQKRTLRACGLSAPKQKHMKTIAAAILDGTLDLLALRALPDDAARAHLTAVKGIGPWTADIYLMSSLARADIWPVGDVALQAAITRAFKLRKRPDPKAMEKLSKRWRPYRTVAARLFWIHEDSLRQEKRAALRKTKAEKGKA